MLSRTNWLRGLMMPSTNGHGPKRAVLYARVSTDEQARSGYSLAQQLEALRAHCEREGYEVLEEVSDPGQSGASLERPGMDRVRDLVAANGVSVVLAQDRDRFAREPAYHYLLRREFEEHGTKIRALNDRGDDSPEGELTDGILDQLAKYERAKFAEKSRRGKLRKAREGKIVATKMPHYGFKHTASRDGYEVDEATMPIVRRIFQMVASQGYSLHGIKKRFEAQGLLTPAGKRYWSETFIREVIKDDVYRPHTFEEVEMLVTPEVAAQLQPDNSYGIWWFNRKRHTYKQVAENGPEGKVYRKKKTTTDKPRHEWIAVPCRTLAYLASWLMSPGRLSKATPDPRLRAEGLGSSLAVFSTAAAVAAAWCRTAARAGGDTSSTTDAANGGTKVGMRVRTPGCAASRN